MGNQKSAPSTGLTEAQILLLENNTGLSRDEIYNWHRQFMSEYPDGNLDQKQFFEIFKKTFPQVDAEKYAKLAFNVFDENHNGKISYEEFLLTVSCINVADRSRNRNQQLELAFDIFDKDKNGLSLSVFFNQLKATPNILYNNNKGTISKKEMEQAVNAIYKTFGIGIEPQAGKAKVDRMLNKFDIDNSNSLDKHEFINFITSDPICQQIFNQ